MWRRLTRLSSLLLLAGCAEPPSSEQFGGLRAGAVLNESTSAMSGEPFASASPDVAIELPRDHGPHPAFRQEWWYWTFVLWRGVEQVLPLNRPAEFGAQLVFFRRALSPQPDPEGWRSTQVYMSHFAVTNVADGAHRFDEALSRELPGLTYVQNEPFSLRLPGASVQSIGDSFSPLHLVAKSEDISVDLRLASTEAPILQGLEGYSAKSEQAASHYYSIPRMSVQGSLTWDERQVPVVGWAWLDREWSTQPLPQGLVGWDWMALMLKDGSELMLYQLVRESGERDAFNYAMHRDASGHMIRFKSHEFTMSPRREVEFDGDAYVVAWQVELDGLGAYLVEAAVDDQLMRTTVRYWEGLVRVSDLNGEYLGDGYLEMTR